MRTPLWRLMTSGLILALASLACGLNVSTGGAPTPDVLGTVVMQTLVALTVSASSPGPEAGVATPSSTATASVSPFPSVTSVFMPLATATILTSSGSQNALVTTSTLCWLGPGSAYEVSSSIKKGTLVQLLGRGDILGWLIVRNPIYHDPCWMPASYLQIDASVNVSALPIFYTPPTPTLTPTLVPTSTP